MREIRIRLLWHKQAQFAGYLLAEQLGLGERAGVRIICEGLDFSCKHVNAVLTGRCAALTLRFRPQAASTDNYRPARPFFLGGRDSQSSSSQILCSMHRSAYSQQLSWGLFS